MPSSDVMAIVCGLNSSSLGDDEWSVVSFILGASGLHLLGATFCSGGTLHDDRRDILVLHDEDGEGECFIPTLERNGETEKDWGAFCR